MLLVTHIRYENFHPLELLEDSKLQIPFLTLMRASVISVLIPSALIVYGSHLVSLPLILEREVSLESQLENVLSVHLRH